MFLLHRYRRRRRRRRHCRRRAVVNIRALISATSSVEIMLCSRPFDRVLPRRARIRVVSLEVFEGGGINRGVFFALFTCVLASGVWHLDKKIKKKIVEKIRRREKKDLFFFHTKNSLSISWPPFLPKRKKDRRTTAHAPSSRGRNTKEHRPKKKSIIAR